MLVSLLHHSRVFYSIAIVILFAINSHKSAWSNGVISSGIVGGVGIGSMALALYLYWPYVGTAHFETLVRYWLHL